MSTAITESALATFRIDCLAQVPQSDLHLVAEAHSLGLNHLRDCRRNTYYLIRGAVDAAAVETLAARLLIDPITERALISTIDSSPQDSQGRRVIEVQKKAGVMDPVEASIIKGARDCGIILSAVRVGTRVEVAGASDDDCHALAWKFLANQAIEEAAIDPLAPLRFPLSGGDTRHPRTEVPIRALDDEALMKLSREGCLSLDIHEMRMVQSHFMGLGRDPTDAELESIAQTWSEHCVHKTLKGIIDYHGPDGEVIIDNLLKQTIAKATKELDRDWCWSVFVDNSGVIEFTPDLGVCIKVETHNHPSAIEPYGGANTGLGGVIRDILGTGLGAKPIFNTNVFCFGELDAQADSLPPGTIHPRHLMKRVVAGVRDYGNRMGIPTVNGAVRFDPRYVGNPLVFCGTAGIIPKDKVFGDAQVGDQVLLIGGRTGRDGIHGATFSSIELTEESETVSSGAVQIGNPIEEKKVADTFLQARDAGCFSATTDCGAGGISSAIGEMGEQQGVRVHLEKVPLKYDGLSYAEIWISESQERLVAAVPPHKLDEALAIFAAEQVEATVVGEITGNKKLELFYHGEQVADLDMHFLHNGLPRLSRKAVFKKPFEQDAQFTPPTDLSATLCAVLARPNVASKEWVIRQYDHEVQAGSIIKPLVGVSHDGPSDAAVVAPLLGRNRGVAVACGLNTCYSDVDAYHAAAAGIEEALRNLVCVGAPIDKVALLDNFSWGNCTKPENLGALVRACQACYDLAMHYGTPFISGKDSLNNEYSHGGQTIIIPHTLLITAMTVVEDIRRCITMDVKNPGDAVIVVGETLVELGGSEFLAAVGGSHGFVPKLDRDRSKATLHAVARATAKGLVSAAHDVSDGGLGVTLAEMAFAGGYGMQIDADRIPRERACNNLATLLGSESLSRLVLTVPAEKVTELRQLLADIPHEFVGTVIEDPVLRIRGLGGELEADLPRLKTAWQSGLATLDD
ncbi:MAG: phosphoribosylformylglycinamidine synthase subunit PurL [Planctomycetota bacterium]|nr:MAG: phosphoribosylformylglycinamidine synthase subunit PurL [Planctomycetota bacterium]